MKVKLKHSRGTIDRAGDTLSEKGKSGVTMSLAMEVLEDFRATHIHPMMVFHVLLKRQLENIDNDSLISQRLKRTPSIVTKLKLQKNMALSQMQDIGGLRIVLDSLDKVYSLKHKLEVSSKQTAFKSVLIEEYDYITTPRHSGYRSLHLVYKYGRNPAKENQCRIEIQIRTKIQHAWATAVEVIGTFLSQPLKQSLGNKDYLDLFKEISRSFNSLEQHSDDFELFKTTLDKIAELKLIDLLKAFTVATDKSQQEKPAKYYLISLDFKSKVVNVTKFSGKNFELANKTYTELEQAHLNDKNFETVLVSVDGINNLRKLYPNYFLDTHEFLAYLEMMKNKIK